MAEQKTEAVLPERRRAVVSGLLIMEARRKRGENGHMKGWTYVFGYAYKARMHVHY